MSEPKRRQLDPRTPLQVEPSAAPTARRPREMPPLELGPPWFGSVRNRRQVDALWQLVASAMLAASVLFFGWRAAVATAICVAVTVVTYILAGQLIVMFHKRYKADSIQHAVLLGMLLALCMPMLPSPEMLVLGSALLGVVAHLVGRAHRVRVHPVALVIVLIWVAPTLLVRSGVRIENYALLQPVNAVLRPDKLVLGDVYHRTPEVSTRAWPDTLDDDATDAVTRPNPHETLIDDQVAMLDSTFMVNMLASGDLVRLEEILFGAVPGPIGATSRGLLILLGLYLMYRRVAWWPVGLAGVLGAAAALHVMPVEQGGQVTVVAARLLEIEPPVAVSYVGYMLLGSPLLLIVLILAPMTAPMSGPGRVIYGVMIGALLVAAQWFLRAPQAAFLSLLVASLLARPLDALHFSPFARSARAA